MQLTQPQSNDNHIAKTVESNDTISKLNDILKSELESSDLPDFHLEYMANIILESPARTIDDLVVMIGDFVDNDPFITEPQIRQKCQSIFTKVSPLVKDKVTSWSAGRLNAPVVMEKVKLISDQEQLEGYSETPFSFEMLKFQNELIDPEKYAESLKNSKQLNREKIKKIEDFKKRMEEIQKMQNRLPKIQINHQKESGYSLDIKVENMSLEVSGKILLENTLLLLASGRKYGLIGKNGIGKTTLLYAIVRKEIPKMNTKPDILMIEQEILGNEKTPVELVLEADWERTSLMEEEAELLKKGGSEARLAEIYERMEEIESTKAEVKAKTLLSGLGFSDRMMTEPSKFLSGGWRMRVSLAKVLFCNPEILLLDEPTNHLDLDAVMWLQEYLQSFPNTVLVVSHAREFLNTVCTDIVLIDDQKLTYYKGNYDNYESQKEANIMRQEKEHETQQKQMAHVQSFIDRFRFNAKKASMVQSRLKYLNKLEKVDKVVSSDPNYFFSFSEPDQIRPPIIRVDEGEFAYSLNDENNLLESLNFAVQMNTKVALLGSNGVGKTTFLKVLTEDLQLRKGTYFKNKKARIGMFSQHHVENLDISLSPLEQFFKLYPDGSNDLVRKHLANFGITANTALRPIYLLSGGQKSRVSLALVAWINPHVLIMDEPTNHLDMDAVDALILALNSYTGGLIIVSHDQYFVSCVCDEIWYIRNKQLRKFNGDFETYRNALATNRL
jgi:ATP-binding cassette subfamily F protein 3